MSKSFKVLFFLKKGKRNNAKALPVYVRITINGQEQNGVFKEVACRFDFSNNARSLNFKATIQPKKNLLLVEVVRIISVQASHRRRMTIRHYSAYISYP